MNLFCLRRGNLPIQWQIVTLVFLLLLFTFNFSEGLCETTPKKHPMMTVKGVKRPSQLESVPKINEARSILKSYSPLVGKPQANSDCGLKIFNEYFAFAEGGLSLLELASDLPILPQFNEYSSNICLLFSLRQFSIDINEGQNRNATLNLSKELLMYSLGKWGSAALKISNVGMFFIDYSLTKFGAKAFKVRKNKYQSMYDEYNARHNRFKKKPDEWKNFLVKTINESRDVKSSIDREVNSYVKDYFYEAGSVIPDDLRLELIEAEKNKLYKIFNDSIEDVINEIRKKKEEEILQNFTKATELMNKEFTISVNVIADKYDPMPIRVVVSEDQKLWEGVTSSAGTWNMRCTYAGYIAYKKPTTVELTYKGKTLTQSFKVTDKGVFAKFDLRDLEKEKKEVLRELNKDLAGTYRGKIFYNERLYGRGEGPIEIIIKNSKSISFKASYKLEKKYYDDTGNEFEKPTGKLLKTHTTINSFEGKGDIKKINPNASDDIIQLNGRWILDSQEIYTNPSHKPYSQTVESKCLFYLIKDGNKLITWPQSLKPYGDNWIWKIEAVKVEN